MASHEIRVSLDEEAVARAAATIREAGKQLSESLKLAQALAVEPWMFYSPAHECNLLSYLDDRNQVRHCKPDLVVPDSWRKIYVEKKA